MKLVFLKSVFAFVIVFMPTMVLAQASSSYIKRPVKKSDSGSTSSAVQKRVIANIMSNMVYVEGGSYKMKGKERSVASFHICKYEVTQEEWIAIMGKNPSAKVNTGNRCPANRISWNDCQAFLQKLNSVSGKKFRLPTELEWEYAASGGQQSKHYNYAGSNNPGDVAWCYLNSQDKVHEVGTKQPNELGLYDMSGNVWEWCSDKIGSGANHVYKGGGYDIYAKPLATIFIQDYNDPVSRYPVCGLRIAY